MGNRVKILDCTLRDGGLGLEDAYKNNISNISFNNKDNDKIIELLNETNIDLIELGSIEISEDDKTKFAIYQNVESISKKIPKKKNINSMYVGLFRGPDTPIDNIPLGNPSLVDGLRVILRYSELKKSLDFCEALTKKGYKVFVQPMLTMRYTDDELDYIIKRTNEMNAYALYFVDSYGYMESNDVLRLFEKYDHNLDKNIMIGFHAHNNMNLAYANALKFIDINTTRQLICDSCAIGMGQGAGNLQTELIAYYLNKNKKKQYNYRKILEICDIIETYTADSMWGYSVTRLLPALHKTAYKYAISLRKHDGLTFSEIDRLLSIMPEELRNRYTPENKKQLLMLAGLYDKKINN